MRNPEGGHAPEGVPCLIHNLEVLVLVQNGLAVGRLGPVPSPPPALGAEEAAEGASTLTGEARAAEIFEQFRSLMEDEF